MKKTNNSSKKSNKTLKTIVYILFAAITLSTIFLPGCASNNIGKEDTQFASNCEQALEDTQTSFAIEGELSKKKQEEEETKEDDVAKEDNSEVTEEIIKEGTQEIISEETNVPETNATAEVKEHTHNFNSEVTRAATCGEDGIRMYTCSCNESYTESIKATGAHNFTSSVIKTPTCSEEGTKLYTCSTCGTSYTEVIGRTNDHEWITLHIDEVGHYESSGTHTVTYKTCHCGFEVNSDMANANEIWSEHNRICGMFYSMWSKEVPNGESKYVVDVPGYDKVYCYLCGATK